jgi:UPF0042 nucleotide-binding protein
MPRSPKSSDNSSHKSGGESIDKQKSVFKTRGLKALNKSKPRIEKSEAQKSGAKEAGAKDLVIVTGTSGSGKASALKAFEDLGFYAVDNLPLELLPDFAELVQASPEMHRAVIVVDVREGPTLDQLPSILSK